MDLQAFTNPGHSGSAFYDPLGLGASPGIIVRSQRRSLDFQLKALITLPYPSSPRWLLLFTPTTLQNLHTRRPIAYQDRSHNPSEPEHQALGAQVEAFNPTVRARTYTLGLVSADNNDHDRMEGIRALWDLVQMDYVKLYKTVHTIHSIATRKAITGQVLCWTM